MKIIDKLADEYSYDEDNYRVYDRGDIAKAFRTGFRKCRSLLASEGVSHNEERFNKFGEEEFPPLGIPDSMSIFDLKILE